MIFSLCAVTKMYDHTPLFENISLQLEVGERIALIGRNGSGKSTLLRIIAREILPDSGELNCPAHISVRALPQKPDFGEGMSVRQVLLAQLRELTSAREEYERISEQLRELTGDHQDKALLARLSALGTFLDHHNAWDLDSKLQRILSEFRLDCFGERPANLLSGGEQKRVALAGLCCTSPICCCSMSPQTTSMCRWLRFSRSSSCAKNIICSLFLTTAISSIRLRQPLSRLTTKACADSMAAMRAICNKKRRFCAR